MDVLMQDLRYAVRALRRDIGFTAVTVLILAVGIGANTGVFSVVHSVLLAPLPYEEPERLAMVWTDIAVEGVHEAPSAYGNIQDWKAQNRVFEDLATFDGTTLTLTGGEWPERIMTGRASANFFSVLRVSPAIGRTFSLEEEEARASVVVLSHALWERWFSASPDAIGRTIEINGLPLEVVGVMPADFGFDRDVQLWWPQTLFSDFDDVATARGTDFWRVLGRVRSGVSMAEAQRDMDVIASRLERAYPNENAGLGINVVPLYDQVTERSYRLALWTLFGAAGLVLLIGCANVANLTLARGMARTRELAIRVALGATRPRLVRQALTENVVVSLTAGIAGLLLAVVGLRVALSLAPGSLPRLEEIGLNTAVLAFAFAVSLASGILFGIAPSLSFSRGDPHEALKHARTPGPRSRGQRARKLLIAFQFALAIVLVFGANLLIRSLVEAQRVDPGFQPENLLMASMSLETSTDAVAFYEQVVENVRTIPGVRSASVVEEVFISGAPNRMISVEGRAPTEARREPMRIDAVVGDYFQTIGAPLLEGRALSRSDHADAVPVAIINETMAQRFWPGETPVGKRFRTGGPESEAPWIEVVGVVGDMRREGLEMAPISQAFRPYAQAPSRSMMVVVRTDQPVPGLAETVRTRVAEIDRTVPLSSMTTVSRELDRQLLQRRFQTLLLGLFSAMALILAAAGIYGLVQHSVSLRTREIGVRVALGALSSDLIVMVIRQGLVLALPGVAAGLLCALWLSDVLSGLLFGVAATDLTSIAVTVGVLLLTTVAACYIPARRAAGVDPVVALKEE